MFLRKHYRYIRVYYWKHSLTFRSDLFHYFSLAQLCLSIASVTFRSNYFAFSCIYLYMRWRWLKRFWQLTNEHSTDTLARRILLVFNGHDGARVVLLIYWSSAHLHVVENLHVKRADWPVLDLRGLHVPQGKMNFLLLHCFPVLCLFRSVFFLLFLKSSLKEKVSESVTRRVLINILFCYFPYVLLYL